MNTNLPHTRHRVPIHVTPPAAVIATVTPNRRAGLHATNVRTIQPRRAAVPPRHRTVGRRRRSKRVIVGLTAAVLAVVAAVSALVIQILGALGATGIGLAVGVILIVLGQRASKPTNGHCPGPYHR